MVGRGTLGIKSQTASQAPGSPLTSSSQTFWLEKAEGDFANFQ